MLFNNENCTMNDNAETYLIKLISMTKQISNTRMKSRLAPYTTKRLFNLKKKERKKREYRVKHIKNAYTESDVCEGDGVESTKNPSQQQFFCQE